MFKQYIAEQLFPELHNLITEKNAQAKKLAKIKKHSDAAYLGIDRRKIRDRRVKAANNNVRYEL